jgi:hypothetical protein
MIHGDDASEYQKAPEGCISLDRYARDEVGADVLRGDDQLIVVE